MPQTKIQGKFYPLKSEEWLNSINKLTHSELKILYYVRSLDPYNNGISLTPAQIARDLSTEKHKMHRSTVGRALKSLDRKGFIDMELLQVRVKVNPKGFLAEPELEKDKNNVVATQQCCDHATQVVATQHRVPPHNIECAHTTQSAPTQQPKAETQSEQELENPKTLKTYSDFKDSLSESERENFFSYVEEKTKNLRQPINDLEAWLASKNAAKQNRWEIYYKNYQEEKISQKSRNNGKNQGAEDFTLAPKKLAIARFKAERNRNRPNLEEDKPENSEEYRQPSAEFNQLIDNPPEYGEQKPKTFAQLRREAIAKANKHREEIRQKAARRAKEQSQQTFEERRQEALRHAEQMIQQEQQQQNNPEINEEEDW